MRHLEARQLWRGLGAGVVGTLALSGVELVRDRLLGHPAPYAVDPIARRGARKWLGVRLSPRAAHRWGLLMRWIYGPTLGALYALVRPRLPSRVRLGGLALGGAVGGLEQLAFPLLGVTTPPRTWSRAEHGLLAVQVIVFGAVTEACLTRSTALPRS